MNRIISASQRCGPKWTENFETSQGYASYNGAPLRQGVTRLQLVLSRKASESSRAMRTFPSSRRLILELMLVKWFCVVVKILTLRLFSLGGGVVLGMYYLRD